MVQYFPVVTGSLTVSGSIIATGAISMSGSIASSSYAVSSTSASYAANATSASYITSSNIVGTVANATSASFAVQAQTASFANSFTVNSTLTAQTLVVQTITSSVDYVTGSTRFGSLSSNTHTFTGSLLISGSSVRISGSQVDYVLNSTASTQYSRLSFEENGVDKAQVQYINSAFSSGNRAGRLEICNASSGGQGISFVSSQSAFNNPQMFISSSGFIGIGTTTPAALLHAVIPSVTGSGNTEIFRLSDSVLCDFKIYLNRGTDVNSSTSVVNTYAGNMAFQTNNTERMRISGSNGYVGIGTTTITAPLTIAVSATGAAIAATNTQTAYDYSRFRIKHYTDSNLGLSIGYSGANYTYIQACYNEGTAGPLFLNPFNGSVGIGTNSPASAALTIHTSGSGGGNAGNQIWIKGGNTNVSSASNAIVLSYSDVTLYSHAIKTSHNSAAINGNSIDFYVWNYGTDATSTVGTRKMMSVDGQGVIKPNQPAFQVTRGSSANQSLANENTVLQFNTATFDTLGNFNTSTYTFSAPVAGRYLFTATVRYDNSVNSSGYIRTYFTVNGASSSTANSFQYGHQILGPGGYSTNYQSGTISAVIQLAAGDSVQVRGGHTGGTELQKESQFSGYLLG